MSKIKWSIPRVNYLTLTLIFFLILLLIGVYFLSYPVLTDTQLYKNIQTIYKENMGVTFTSERAKFSFKHPSLPISVVDFEARNGMYKYLEKDGVVEFIDFGSRFSSPPKEYWGPSYGFIIVSKSNYTTLKDYVDDLTKEEIVEKYIKGVKQKVTIKPPKIEYLKIGGVEAICVTEVTEASLRAFSPDYRLIRNGLLYRFANTVTTISPETSCKDSTIFEQIISSVKFFD